MSSSASTASFFHTASITFEDVMNNVEIDWPESYVSYYHECDRFICTQTPQTKVEDLRIFYAIYAERENLVHALLKQRADAGLVPIVDERCFFLIAQAFHLGFKLDFFLGIFMHMVKHGYVDVDHRMAPCVHTVSEPCIRYKYRNKTFLMIVLMQEWLCKTKNILELLKEGATFPEHLPPVYDEKCPIYELFQDIEWKDFKRYVIQKVYKQDKKHFNPCRTCFLRCDICHCGEKEVAFTKTDKKKKNKSLVGGSNQDKETKELAFLTYDADMKKMRYALSGDNNPLKCLATDVLRNIFSFIAGKEEDNEDPLFFEFLFFFKN